jgi:hypothetical protein
VTDFEFDSDAVRRTVAARRVVNVIIIDLLVRVDFIPVKDAPFQRAEFSRRRRVDLGDFLAWIISPEELVLSKLAWAR